MIDPWRPTLRRPICPRCRCGWIIADVHGDRAWCSCDACAYVVVLARGTSGRVRQVEFAVPPNATLRDNARRLKAWQAANGD